AHAPGRRRRWRRRPRVECRDDGSVGGHRQIARRGGTRAVLLPPAERPARVGDGVEMDHLAIVELLLALVAARECSRLHLAISRDVDAQRASGSTAGSATSRDARRATSHQKCCRRYAADWPHADLACRAETG